MVDARAATPCYSTEAVCPSEARAPPKRALTPPLTASPVPASRRRDLTGAGPLILPRARVRSPGQAAAAGAAKRKSLPSTHMRCRTHASFRAKATFARRMPRRFTTSSAQRLRAENLPARVSITFAAS